MEKVKVGDNVFGDVAKDISILKNALNEHDSIKNCTKSCLCIWEQEISALRHTLNFIKKLEGGVK